MTFHLPSALNHISIKIAAPKTPPKFHAGPSQGALGAAAGGPAAAGESPGAAESLPAVIPTPGVGAAAAP